MLFASFDNSRRISKCKYTHFFNTNAFFRKVFFQLLYNQLFILTLIKEKVPVGEQHIICDSFNKLFF